MRNKRNKNGIKPNGNGTINPIEIYMLKTTNVHTGQYPDEINRISFHSSHQTINYVLDGIDKTKGCDILARPLSQTIFE